MEGKVQGFVLGRLRDPDTFRERVERQAEAERRELLAGDREVRGLRRELEELDHKEDNLVEAIAEGGRLGAKLQEKIEQIQSESRYSPSARRYRRDWRPSPTPRPVSAA